MTARIQATPLLNVEGGAIAQGHLIGARDAVVAVADAIDGARQLQSRHHDA